VNELAARTVLFERARARVKEGQLAWAGVALISAALTLTLACLSDRWPPHEDETLALFVGRESFGELLHTVMAERGGAPLHFVFAWMVAHLSGGLGALRAVSITFAVASVPLIALLGARLANRAAGLVAAAIASASWVLLFDGVFGRMYSLFLFTSVLSFLALLSALDRGTPGRFALWGASLLLLLATHPYALLVIGAQALFIVLQRARLRPALVTLALVAAAGSPFLWADVVLRDRFDVGLGGGGDRLGSPGAVLQYLYGTFADYTTGRGVWAIPVGLLALVGAVLLGRRRSDSLVLALCVVVVPAVAFTVATLGSATSPEARHLIFALPFFSLLLALPLSELARVRPPVPAALALGALALLVAGEVRAARDKTPALFAGDPPGERQARAAAAAWLASTAKHDDVLLGYEPVYLRAWELNSSFSAQALPRADPKLLAAALRDVSEPVGRGVWVFDASDTTNVSQRQTIPFVLPKPASAFEGRVYGPYLVIRSRAPLGTREHYLRVSQRVMRVGQALQITDAEINLEALVGAESRL
jgi:mannosyltransferase